LNNGFFPFFKGVGCLLKRNKSALLIQSILPSVPSLRYIHQFGRNPETSLSDNKQWKGTDTPPRYHLIEAVGPYEAFRSLLKESSLFQWREFL
jgi:hypothetical protein